MTQHGSLTAERWSSFSPEARLLMIANEMNRTGGSLAPEHEESRRLGYERVLRLTDLTIELAARPARRRELLRWRDLVAELYVGGPDPARHAAAFRVLLLSFPAGAEQLRALSR